MSITLGSSRLPGSPWAIFSTADGLRRVFVGDPIAPDVITAWDAVDTEAGGELEILISDAGHNGGRPVIDRQYRIDGGAEVSFGPSMAHVITGLTDGVEVSIEVRQRNEIGWGDWSAPILRTPTQMAATVPGVVSAWDVFDRKAGGELEIVISNPGSDGGSAITDRQYRIDGGSWVSFGANLSHVITGLADGVEVSVEVRQGNTIGWGAASGPIYRTPTAAGTAPTDPIAAELFWPHRYGGVWDAFTASSAFSDDAATTQAAHNDGVASVDDLTNNEKWARQTISVARPTLWVDGDVRSFRFDGDANSFDLPEPFDATGSDYFIAYAAALDFTTGHMLLANSTDNATRIQTSAASVSVRHDGSAHQAVLSLPEVVRGQVFIDRIEYRNGQVSAWRDGVASPDNPVALAQPPVAPWDRIGRRGDNANAMDGDLFFLTVRGGEPPTEQQGEWLDAQILAKWPEPPTPPPPEEEDLIEISPTLNSQAAADANWTMMHNALLQGASEGKRVGLPAGTIFINKRFASENGNYYGTGFVGLGANRSTIIKLVDNYTADNGWMINVKSHPVNFELRNICLDGNKDGTTTSQNSAWGSAGVRMDIGLVERLLLEDVDIINTVQAGRQMMGGATPGAVTDRRGRAWGCGMHGWATRGNGSSAVFGTHVVLEDYDGFENERNNIDLSSGYGDFKGIIRCRDNLTSNTGNMKISVEARELLFETMLFGPTAGGGWRTTGKSTGGISGKVIGEHWEINGQQDIGLRSQEEMDLLKVGYLKMWDNGKGSNAHEILWQGKVVEIDVLEVFDANRGDGGSTNEAILFSGALGLGLGSGEAALKIGKLILRNNRARVFAVRPGRSVLVTIDEAEIHNNNRGNLSSHWIIEADSGVTMNIGKLTAWDNRSTPRQTQIARAINGGSIAIGDYLRGAGAQWSGSLGSGATASNITDVNV